MATEPRGHLLAEFLAEDLVAWLGDHLPSRQATASRAIAGSSLGGLAALYVAWLHPHTFPRVAAFSPSVMWSGGQLTRHWRRKAPGQRVYLDAGARERFDGGGFELDYGGATRDFAAHLRGVGHGEDDLRVVLDPAGTHDEVSWGRRFPDAMRWLLGGR